MDSLKSLCEAIVLQSMEEVLSRKHVKENVDFLLGEGMDICSSIIGMNPTEQEKVLDFTFRHGYFEELKPRRTARAGAA